MRKGTKKLLRIALVLSTVWWRKALGLPPLGMLQLRRQVAEVAEKCLQSSCLFFFGEERGGGGVGRLDGLEVEAELSRVAALFSEEAVWME